MSFPDLVSANQRLHILKMLEQDADYSHNQQILAAGLAAIGHGIGIDQVRDHIRWLEQADLVTVKDLHGVGLVAGIKRKGIDVANGHTRIEGVARPLPGA